MEEDSFNLPAFNLLPTAVVQWGRGGPKDKQRVQSLEFADNPRRLFVGSTEGRVFMYGLEMASVGRVLSVPIYIGYWLEATGLPKNLSRKRN